MHHGEDDNLAPLFNTEDAYNGLTVNELKSVILLDADMKKKWSIGVSHDRSSLVSDNNFDFVLRFRR